MLSALLPALLVKQHPVAREVTLPDGSVHTLHFKQLAAAEFRRFFQALQDGNHDAQSRAMAGLIAASLCDAEGQPGITEAQALLLTPAAERALSAAVMAINGLGKREDSDLGNASPSAANSGSGTS